MKNAHRPLIQAGIVLGIGLGGFLDGIVFHQILQLHSMMTGRIDKSSVANVEVNMFWDGLFHALTWTVTVIGVALLFRAARRTDVPWSARTFVGAQFLGWGLFNFVEGLFDHHVLHLHHVVETLGVSIFDYFFLASGLVFMLGGWMAIRHDGGRDLEDG